MLLRRNSSDSSLLIDLAGIGIAVLDVLVVLAVADRGWVRRQVDEDLHLGIESSFDQASLAMGQVALAELCSVFAAVRCSVLVLEVVEPVVVMMAWIACQLAHTKLARLGRVVVFGSVPPESKLERESVLVASSSHKCVVDRSNQWSMVASKVQGDPSDMEDLRSNMESRHPCQESASFRSLV